MKERYQLLVGEKGNVIGHILSIRCKSVKSTPVLLIKFSTATPADDFAGDRHLFSIR